MVYKHNGVYWLLLSCTGKLQGSNDKLRTVNIEIKAK